MIAGGLPRLGVLGCGWIAGNRLRQIEGEKLARVVAAADPDPEAFGVVRGLALDLRCETSADAWNDTTVDGVMISTPSALHCRQAVSFLERGVPVFVQKPLGLCPDEVDHVLSAAAAGNLPVDTDLCYRHLESTLAVRRELQEGSIGRPFHIEGRFHNAYRPGAGWSHQVRLAGGGALMDLGIHLLDLVMWMTDSPVFLRDAHLRFGGRPWWKGRLEDFAALELELPGGAPVRLDASWDASTGRDAEIGLRIFGERGTLELCNRNGSFFDFEARLCRGPEVSRLAADDGDGWQAGPLRTWLKRVREGAGYEELPWVRRSMVIIEEAYDFADASLEAKRTARGTVHALAGKGVLQ